MDDLLLFSAQLQLEELRREAARQRRIGALRRQRRAARPQRFRPQFTWQPTRRSAVVCCA